MGATPSDVDVMLPATLTRKGDLAARPRGPGLDEPGAADQPEGRVGRRRVMVRGPRERRGPGPGAVLSGSCKGQGVFRGGGGAVLGCHHLGRQSAGGVRGTPRGPETPKGALAPTSPSLRSQWVFGSTSANPQIGPHLICLVFVAPRVTETGAGVCR